VPTERRVARRACCICLLTLLTASFAFLADDAYALPFTMDVFCEDEKCGTMEISTYKVAPKFGLDLPPEKWFGGVQIQGKFRDIAKQSEYHYVQALKLESDTFRWFNGHGVALPEPFLDTPPGGYKIRTSATSQTWGGGDFDDKGDYLPWYDQKTFPRFSDRPTDYLLLAKGDDMKLEAFFETWLVCVIQDLHDGDKEAKDDSHTIAPLIGWLWGYLGDQRFERATPDDFPEQVQRPRRG
jgi:hypothetical protein